jgi:hypothetical protein
MANARIAGVSSKADASKEEVPALGLRAVQTRRGYKEGKRWKAKARPQSTQYRSPLRKLSRPGRRRLERTGSSIVGGLSTPEIAGGEKLLDPGQPVVELGQRGLCRSRAGPGVFTPPPGGLLDEAR